VQLQDEKIWRRVRRHIDHIVLKDDEVQEIPTRPDKVTVISMVKIGHMGKVLRATLYFLTVRLQHKKTMGIHVAIWHGVINHLRDS